MKAVDMGKAPPTTLINTARVLLRYIGPQSALAENVFYIHSTAYQGTQPQCDFIAGCLQTAWAYTGSLHVLLNPLWTLQSTICQDNSGTGNFSQNVVNATGSDPVAGNALPPNVAAVISWDVDKRYKGGHPRTYLPGIGEGNLVNPGGTNWNATFTSGLKAAGKTFLTQFISALSAQLAGAAVGTLSRRSNYVWNTPPNFWPYIDTKSHPRVDTQRRRLGKEITSG